METVKPFNLEFIKFDPILKIKHKLTYTETLVYWYIKEVILFQKKHWNKWVCFTSSKTIWRNIWTTSWTIDKSVGKLKNLWLIEVHNKFIVKYNRNSRYIYMPWEAPKSSEDKVEYFFYEVSHLLEDNKKTRAIIWSLLYKKWISSEELIDNIEKCFDYLSGELLNENDIKEFYRIYT